MIVWTGLLVIVVGMGVAITALVSSGSKKPVEEPGPLEVKESQKLTKLAENFTRGIEDRSAKDKKPGLFSKQSLSFADLDVDGGTLLVWIVLSSLIAAFVSVLFMDSFPLAFVGLVAPYFGTRFYIKRRIKQKQFKFAVQLGDSLQVISSTLQAGQSLNVALSTVAEEADEPMRSEMGRVLNEVRLGRDIVVALNDTAARMKCDDLEWFTSAVQLQRRTGGNLVKIIETVSATIRERAELRLKIKAYASEGRASAYVLMGLPVGVGGILFLIDRAYLAPLFNNALGLAIVSACVVMYFIGYFWMSKVIAIKI